VFVLDQGESVGYYKQAVMRSVVKASTWQMYEHMLAYQCLLQPDSWSPVSEGFVGDPWLFTTLTSCRILHFVSHWPVLVYFINICCQLRPSASDTTTAAAGAAVAHVVVHVGFVGVLSNPFSPS
jgi:hypothetical protein